MGLIRTLTCLLVATPAYADGIVKDYNETGCKTTIINEDGEEEERPCTVYESAEYIKSARAFGRIVTSSGAELRQYPELTKWLINEEYEKYHNLDLQVRSRESPTLQVLDKKGKVQDTWNLSKYSTRADLEALLSSLDFEKKVARTDEL